MQFTKSFSPQSLAFFLLFLYPLSMKAQEDTSRVLRLITLSSQYRNSKPDSALFYGQQALILVQQINFPKGKAQALNNLAFIYRVLGDMPKSLDMQFKALKIAEQQQYQEETLICLMGIGVIYSDINDYTKAILYCKRAKKIATIVHDTALSARIDMNIGNNYRKNNQLDSAYVYIQDAYRHINLVKSADIQSAIYMVLGTTEYQLGNHTVGLEYLQKSIDLNQKYKYHRINSLVHNMLAGFCIKRNQSDSAIVYAKKGLAEGDSIAYKQGVLEASNLLVTLYESKNKDSAFHYLKIAKTVNEDLYGVKRIQDLQKMVSYEMERQGEIEATKIAEQNRIKLYTLFAGLGIMSLIGFILYRNNRQQQKANNLLHSQKTEIDSQREKAENALTQLKAMQTQLIQSEKLASLGELTAGISHEIQNPLNFVTNFSELSMDLVKELKEEMDKPDMDKAYIEELFIDLNQNQDRIKYHGRRASRIVKGMLEHSRASTGVKELTDINKLADEYLRLSYHGLRAKNKSFNADFKTDFDVNLPNITVIPQDIGRVLLNLFNNAFYAVHQRRQQLDASFKLASSSSLDKNYTPSVFVTTQYLDNQIIIKVKDNGTGMPESVRAKIFQPFFTTKPTGEGTGLGLSLSYDIVTKGHGGSLEVESTDGTSRDNREGVGTFFIITLPIQTAS